MTSNSSMGLAALGARPATIARWLLCVATMVFAIVVIGGITRLTESGLSITEWKPITGIMPPLTEAQWLDAFHRYQQIPEYQQLKQGMSLADFKSIFFWEWLHRVIARTIGLVFALPLLWFAWKRAIPRGYGLRLVVLLILGGMQGVIGWWMVTSGLTERTDVSHYRLAVHLLAALVIMAALIWTALDLFALGRNSRSRPARLTPFAALALLILFIQLMFGAFTAGLNAGYVANTWPLMNDHFVPEGIEWVGGLWHTLSSDLYLVHFFHRWFAWVTALVLIMLARMARKAGNRGASIAINATVGLQIMIGIATVLSGIEISLAVLHQAVGALVVAATIWGAHAVGYRRV